ncbi:MAG: FAD:protein FMN transferase [Gemmatimonadota bacterium]|nr:FAD:protein FMN transferase [Gemmatimonadota bacterium]
MRRRELLRALAGVPLLRFPGQGQPRRQSPLGSRDLAFVERWSWAMGQAVRLRLFCGSVAAGAEAAQAAFAELRRVEALLSRFEEGSALSELNRQAGSGPWRAPTELLAVLSAAAKVRGMTGGAFDVAVEPLMRVWGFREPRETLPLPQEVAEAEAAVRAAVVLVGEGTIHLPARHTRLDLGGIGVGYGLDRAASVLRARGVGSALLEVSGDLIAMGAPPGQDGWAVDVVDSADPARRPLSVTLRDRALATSAARGATVRLGAVERGHLMDPRGDGRKSGARQATVVAPSALLADALSTAAVVSGRAAPGPVETWIFT